MIRVLTMAAIAIHHPLPRQPYLYVTSMNVVHMNKLRHNRQLHNPRMTMEDNLSTITENNLNLNETTGKNLTKMIDTKLPSSGGPTLARPPARRLSMHRVPLLLRRCRPAFSASCARPVSPRLCTRLEGVVTPRARDRSVSEAQPWTSARDVVAWHSPEGTSATSTWCLWTITRGA